MNDLQFLSIKTITSNLNFDRLSELKGLINKEFDRQKTEIIKRCLYNVILSMNIKEYNNFLPLIKDITKIYKGDNSLCLTYKSEKTGKITIFFDNCNGQDLKVEYKECVYISYNIPKEIELIMKFGEFLEWAESKPSKYIYLIDLISIFLTKNKDEYNEFVKNILNYKDEEIWLKYP